VPANGAEPPTFLLSPPLDSPTFAPALGLQLSVLARDGIEQARMQLNPESMGPISVQLSVAGTQVNIDFVASQAPTREALQQSMPELASAMRDAGFTLTGGGVFQQARDGAPGEQAPGWPGLPGAGPNAAEAADAEAEGGRLGATRRVTPRGLVDVYA
jgi:flagellar hook-length control protein FliK